MYHSIYTVDREGKRERVFHEISLLEVEQIGIYVNKC